MSKILQGKVVSNKMNSTVVVEVSRRVPHKLYKKLLKKSKRYKVDTRGQKLEIGQTINIIQTRPIAKNKHFAVFTDEKKQAKSHKMTKSKEKKA